MPTMNLNIVDEPGDFPTVDCYINGDIGGGDATVADGSVTTDKLAANAVTNDKIAEGTIQAAKLASGVIPTLPSNATTSVAGLVKQSAHLDPSTTTTETLIKALITAGIMASA